MKVTIFETEHFEGAYPVIRLFQHQGCELTILTTAETYQRFLDLFPHDHQRFTWEILPTTGKRVFFTGFYDALKRARPHLLYINTISNNHLLYAIALARLRIARVVMTIHDINCLFKSKPSLSFRKMVIHRGKKKLLDEVGEFNVVADTMLPYLRTLTHKPLHNIPGAVFQNQQSVTELSAPVRIVVPGSIDKRRRDYRQVFELATLAEERKQALHIVLLGGFTDDYGRDVWKKAGEISSAFVTIQAYNTNIVDQAEFDQQMDAAHFIWIPSVINTRICGDIPEVYGQTKSSGNIFDVIKHAKPFIAPAGLSIPASMKESCFVYENSVDIRQFLEKCIQSHSLYTNLVEAALTSSKEYTIRKVIERNPALFSDTGLLK